MNHHKLAGAAYLAMAGVTLLTGWAFSLAEHLPLLSGWYWAIITVTTIGYGDVIPHNSDGRAAAVVLAVVGVPLYGLTTALFTSWLMAGHFRRHLAAVHKEEQP